MPYWPTGQDRDSYISGVRPGASKWGAVHDVNARRDNLPDNVFSYISEGVAREERLRQVEQDKIAVTRMQIANGKGGKKMPGARAVDANAAMNDMEQLSILNDRHEALVALYAQERAQWEQMLSSKGLAMTRV